VQLPRRGANYEQRLFKYGKRGLEILIPDLEHDRIDPKVPSLLVIADSDLRPSSAMSLWPGSPTLSLCSKDFSYSSTILVQIQDYAIDSMRLPLPFKSNCVRFTSSSIWTCLDVDQSRRVDYSATRTLQPTQFDLTPPPLLLRRPHRHLWRLLPYMSWSQYTAKHHMGTARREDIC
jgi:hypothetical protein